jgi:hypothetical protein
VEKVPPKAGPSRSPVMGLPVRRQTGNPKTKPNCWLLRRKLSPPPGRTLPGAPLCAPAAVAVQAIPVAAAAFLATRLIFERVFRSALFAVQLSAASASGAMLHCNVLQRAESRRASYGREGEACRSARHFAEAVTHSSKEPARSPLH